MAGIDVMSERTEQATPYKLQKAKEQGKVSKSTELNTYILLLVMLGLISLLWPSQIKEVQALLSHLLYLASHVHFTTDNISHLHQLILSQLILLWVPVAFAAVLTIILSTIVQTGLVWSTKVLVPDFKRLNLAQGLKKLCSINSLFDAIKTVIKFCSASILLFYLFKNQLPVMIHHALSQARPDPSLPMHFMLRIIFQLLLLLFFLAILEDFLNGVAGVRVGIDPLVPFFG